MVAVLAQFVDTVPQPLTDALVNLAPILAVTARVARIFAWSEDWHTSWIALALWWFVCLASRNLFRLVFPIVLAVGIIWITRGQSKPIVTETLLQAAIADLVTLRNALPTPPPIPLHSLAILRAAAILTIPWLILSYLVPLHILLALIGTLVLTHRAPWARVLRSILWRSAFVRTSLHRFHSFLTSQPLPNYVISNQPTPTTPAPVPSLRFLFTVYENQRWWMGLDWTAALLPAERPSWCSPSLQPVPPPNAFTLPDLTTVYLPTPDGKSRIKRSAAWKWEESEWRLLVRREGSSLSRIERPPPSDDPSTLSPSSPASSGSRLLKVAANKLKDTSLTSHSRSTPSTHSDIAPTGDTDQDESSEELCTDIDGWIYGDNKWENQSHRGGLGKYTRYRRWTRIAIVSELVEAVEPGEIGIQHTQNTTANDPHPDTTPKTDPEPIAQMPSPTTLSVPNSSDAESPLRQRLRAALSKSTSPP